MKSTFFLLNLQISTIRCRWIPWWLFRRYRYIKRPRPRAESLTSLLVCPPRSALLVSFSFGQALGLSRGILPCIVAPPAAQLHSLRIALPFVTKRAILAAFAIGADGIVPVATAVELEIMAGERLFKAGQVALFECQLELSHAKLSVPDVHIQPS